MGNFCLVGRVGRVPAWIFENVALDDRGEGGGVVALADVGREEFVLLTQGVGVAQVIAFGHGRSDIERLLILDGGGDGLGNQFVDGCNAHSLKHVC